MPPLAPKINKDSPLFKPSVVSRPARAVTASTAMAAACGMVSFPGMSAKLFSSQQHTVHKIRPVAAGHDRRDAAVSLERFVAHTGDALADGGRVNGLAGESVHATPLCPWPD